MLWLKLGRRKGPIAAVPMLRAVLLFLLSGPLLAAETHPLRVGMDLSYPPFETIGPDGKPTGVSVDLAAALAADLGRPLIIENIPEKGSGLYL
jgi:polar amino acid transport system substrate-binding protein